MEEVVASLKKTNNQKRKRVASEPELNAYHSFTDEGYTVVDPSKIGVISEYYSESTGLIRGPITPIGAFFCLFPLKVMEMILKLVNDNLRQKGFKDDYKELSLEDFLKFIGIWILLAI